MLSPVYHLEQVMMDVSLRNLGEPHPMALSLTDYIASAEGQLTSLPAAFLHPGFTTWHL